MTSNIIYEVFIRTEEWKKAHGYKGAFINLRAAFQTAVHRPHPARDEVLKTQDALKNYNINMWRAYCDRSKSDDEAR
ncbi:MAG: hypothetical protein AABZ57_03030 [Candidatus Margulisiibacteriota bacterium]